jgi:predicted RNA-binding protein associated with RNAse of E/G family
MQSARQDAKKLMESITVIKLNPAGEETWRYPCRVLERQVDRAVVEGTFNREDMPFNGIVLRRGDRFVEKYYTDRWYNLFEIHDRDDDRLKGWYCNIAHPAVIDEKTITYIDLALDLLVFPDGRQLVLDEDEYEALALPPEVQQQARQAMEALQASFTARFAG